MAFDFANLRIERIIVHEIFTRKDNREIVDPSCSDSLTILEGPGLQTMQKRIVDAIGKDSRAIEMYVNENVPLCTFDTCTKLLDTEDTAAFIELSKLIPRKLTEAQTSRSMPGGIVIVITGLVGTNSNRFVSIIKAELHDGFGKQNNAQTLALSYLSNLALTPQQKLYKIGFFIETSIDETESDLRLTEDFQVFVYDHNINKDGLTQFAQYFYETFLGCSFTKNGKKLTRDFYFTTVKFINGLDKDEETKIDLITGLHSYLKVNQSTLVDPAEFGNTYFEEGDRDAYAHSIIEAGIPPAAFVKDLTYIKDKLKRRKLTFSSKVKILAPSDNFDELIQIINSEGEQTLLSIQGKVVNEL
jgi:hypothetical protein